MKKKLIIIIAIILVVLIGAGFTFWTLFFKDEAVAPNANPIPVTSVSSITGFGSGISSQTKFSGVVEPQLTLEIKKDEQKKIGEIFVKVGDSIKSGDELFRYDTTDLQLKLDQAKLELESSKNTINSLYGQIKTLEKERANAPSSEKLGYTLQIQSLELDIRTKEYENKAKETNIAGIEKSLTNVSVVSEIDGTLIDINDDNSYDQYSGESKPYMTILSTGTYKITGTISELNLQNFTVGSPVVIRSRIDDNTWTGTVENIDMDNPEEDNNNQYGGSGNNKATKYKFTVTLNSYDGLMLGQHVYVELDFGTGEVKDGLWLSDMYIVFENETPFIWKKGKSDKLEKVKLELGEFDSNLASYEIISGLSQEDYIAFPTPELSNGMPTVIGGDSGFIPPSNNGGGMVTPEGDGFVIPEGNGFVMPEGDNVIVVPEGEFTGGLVPESNFAGSENGIIAVPEGAARNDA